MTDLFTPTLILIVLVAIIIGAGMGIGLLILVQRSQNGGKSLSALRQERQDYQNEVDAHFDKTAHLFKDMTENYRQLYEHMASGAQILCKTESVIQPLDLPAPAAAPEQLADHTASGAETATTAEPDTPVNIPEAAPAKTTTATAMPATGEDPLDETETAASAAPEAKAQSKTKKTSASPQDVLKQQPSK